MKEFTIVADFSLDLYGQRLMLVETPGGSIVADDWQEAREMADPAGLRYVAGWVWHPPEGVDRLSWHDVSSTLPEERA